MKSHPIQVNFTHNGDVIAKHTLPHAVAAPAGTSSGKPARVEEDIQTLFTSVMDAIGSSGFEVAIEPVDVALLLGKAFLRESLPVGDAYEVCIPVTIREDRKEEGERQIRTNGNADREGWDAFDPQIMTKSNAVVDESRDEDIKPKPDPHIIPLPNAVIDEGQSDRIVTKPTPILNESSDAPDSSTNPKASAPEEPSGKSS